MAIYHVTISVRGRRALARGEAERRELVRVVTRTGAGRLLLFGLVDDHLHTVLRTARPGYLTRDLRRVLRNRRPELGLKPAHVESVGTRAYLSWLVRYVLGQPAKHGLSTHPALWSGSCFQDLLGARLLPGLDRAVLLEELPRFRLRQAFEAVGLEPRRLTPADDDALRRAGAARLANLASAVFAAPPLLGGRGRLPHVVRARALAATAGCAAGLPPAEIANYVGVRPRAVQRLAARSALDAVALSALRVRLALEDRVAATAGARSA